MFSVVWHASQLHFNVNENKGKKYKKEERRIDEIEENHELQRKQNNNLRRKTK